MLKNNIKQLLNNRDYKLLLMAGIFSTLGSTIAYIGLMSKLYSLTSNPVDLGLMALLTLIPGVLIGGLGGSIVDRYDRKKIMLASDFFCGITAFFLIFVNSVAVIYILVFMHGLFRSLFGPAYMAIEADILDEKDLVAANSMSGFFANIVSIMGPALGGVLVASVGHSTTFLVDFLSYFLSFIFISRVSYKYVISSILTTKIKNKFVQTVDDIKGAFLYAKKSKIILACLSAEMVITIIFSFQGPLIFSFVTESLHASSEMAGYFFSAAGIGGVFGTLIAMNYAEKLKSLKVMAVILIVDGVVFALFSISNVMTTSLGLFLLAGVIGPIISILIDSLLQTSVDDKFRGRIFSFQGFISGSCGLVSISIATILTKYISVQSLFTASAVLEIITGFVIVISYGYTEMSSFEVEEVTL